MKKIIIIVTAALMIFACGGDRGKGHTKVNQESRKFIFDSLLAGSFNGNDLQWSLEGIDSLEQSGKITALLANYGRAYIHELSGDHAKAKEWYRRVTDCQPSDDDGEYYQRAGYMLSSALYFETNYEGAMREAIPILAYIDSTGSGLCSSDW